MTFIDMITTYWSLIAFLLGLAFHVVWTYFKVGEHSNDIVTIDKRLHDLETEQDKFREIIQRDIAIIKNSLDYVGRDIKEIKNTINKE